MKRMWMDIWTGAIYTRAERDKILEEEYDFDDYTNALEIYDYFEPVYID